MKRTAKKGDHVKNRKTFEIESGPFYMHRTNRTMSIHCAERVVPYSCVIKPKQNDRGTGLERVALPKPRTINACGKIYLI